MNIDEMLRLACIYAEEDRRSFADCMSGCRSPEDRALVAETLAFADKLHAYRIKRWGRTKNEVNLDNAVSVPIALINKPQGEQK